MKFIEIIDKSKICVTYCTVLLVSQKLQYCRSIKKVETFGYILGFLFLYNNKYVYLL